MTGRKRVVISIFDDVDNPHYDGGGPVVVQRVVASLAQDYEVVVVTGGRIPRWRRRDGILHVFLPVVWAGPRLGQLLWGLLLPLAAAVGRYDLWIESFTPPFSSNFIPLVTRRPVLGLAQALSGAQMSRRYATTIPLRIEARLLRAYCDIVVLNDADGRDVSTRSPGTVVHLVRNTVAPPTRPLTDAALGEHALCLGRIDINSKGLDLLVQTYQQLPSPALPMIVAGAGRERDEARWQELLAGAPGIQWVGRIVGEAKEDLFARCAFVVVPSREESFNLVALEAMARGRPVIRFDVPQLSWIPEDCGIVVPAFDTEQLGAAIARMSSDLALRSATGRRAAAAAAKILQADRANPYLGIVNGLIGRDAQAAAPQLRTTLPRRSAWSSPILQGESMITDVPKRLKSQVRLNGVAGTAKVLGGQLRGALDTHESHVWYELRVGDRRPHLPLPEGMVLRRGGQADIAVIDRIPPVSGFQARARLDAGAELWMLMDGDQPAFLCWVLRGVAPTAAVPGGGLTLPRGVVNLEDSVTLPDYRGRGLAPAAWSQLFDTLQANGVESVVTKVAVDNAPSRKAVGKAGFAELATVTLDRRATRRHLSVVPAQGAADSWLMAGFRV